MKAEAMNLLQWQERFGTEEGCIEALKQQRWSSGFQCPKCGHDHGHWIASRKVYLSGWKCGPTCAFLQASTAPFVVMPLRIKVLRRVRVL